MDEQELDKQFQEMEGDTQVQAAEAATTEAPPPKKRPTVAGLKKELDDLKADVEESVLSWLGELATRLDALEKGFLADAPPVWSEIDRRLTNQDAAIGALSDALRSHLEEPAATPQQPETEIEFAQPPQQRAGGAVELSSIAAIASVFLTMNDVLMICRALKEVPELTDLERNEILNIAGEISGVEISSGLKIRAGVRNVGA